MNRTIFQAVVLFHFAICPAIAGAEGQDAALVVVAKSPAQIWKKWRPVYARIITAIKGGGDRPAAIGALDALISGDGPAARTVDFKAPFALIVNYDVAPKIRLLAKSTDVDPTAEDMGALGFMQSGDGGFEGVFVDRKVYARKARGYWCCSNEKELAEVPRDVTTLFGAPSEEDLVVSAIPSALPESVRRLILLLAKASGGGGGEPASGGAAERYGQEQGAKQLHAALDALAFQCRSLRLALSFDELGKGLEFKTSVSPLPDTGAARTIKSLERNSARSSAAFLTDAAIAFHSHGAALPYQIDMVNEGTRRSREEHLRQGRPHSNAGKEFVDLVRSTAERNEMDFSFSISSQSERIALALTSATSKATAEKALLAFAKDLASGELKFPLKVGAEELKGAKVSELTLLADNLKKHLGDEPGRLATSESGLHIVLGPAGRERLSALLETGKSRELPWLAIKVNMPKVFGLLGMPVPAAPEKASIRFTVRGGETLDIRLTAEPGLLELLPPG